MRLRFAFNSVAARNALLLPLDVARIWAGDAGPLKWLNSEDTHGIDKAQSAHPPQRLIFCLFALAQG